MDYCELVEIDTNKPLIRHRLDAGGENDQFHIEEYVPTEHGQVLVARQGAKFRRNSYQCCILTFHDLGLNYQSNFLAFFNYPTMKPVLDKMPIYHINAPGQEKNADDLPNDYQYPTLEEMSDMLKEVCGYYGINRTICIGAGLGANIMSRFATKNTDLVDGLFLINPVPTAAGWVEWAYQKRNIFYLTKLDPSTVSINRSTFPQCIIDYLTWHHFGYSIEERSTDLANMYKAYFSSGEINPKNLALLMESYVRREDVGINRVNGRRILCNTLILTGNDSPFLEDSIEMNTRLDPKLSNWMKLFDCAMTLDEQPGKVAQAFILFVQGLGLGLLNCVKI